MSHFQLLATIVLVMCVSVHAADDITTVRDRYVQSDLPTSPAEIQQIHDTAAKYVKTLQPDGSWPDVDYKDQARSAWLTSQHLTRVIVMAKSARLDRDAGHRNQELDARVLNALKFWTDHNFQNTNWWWNQIGVPKDLGEIALLLWPDIPDAQVSAIVRTMNYDVWTKWTGANLTWGATIQIMRGCLEQTPPTIADAFARIYQEIRVTKQPEEGIQVDGSFHQHGKQLYNGGYGMAFSNDVGRYIWISWGTAFQVPPEQMQIFSSYILDGQRWMGYRNIFDYSTEGREITRLEKLGLQKDWTAGMIVPPGPAYSVWNTCNLLASLNTPRKQDFAQLASQLIGDAGTPPISGNRQFWCSDYMVHRRGDFMTSVKMLSTRMRNAENVNNEGRQSHHLSQGANFIYVDGTEYNNVFGVWDWNKVPGTTVEVVKDLPKEDPKGIGLNGGSDFVGGASDGVNGLCAMNLIREGLAAKKSWFFFDHAYACLGAGITLKGDRDVVTSINQCHLVGDVMTSSSPTTLPSGQHELTDARWIYHNHVGYVFAAGEKTVLSNADQSGRWADFGTGSNALVTLPVFNLWIDHGVGCKDASYEYFVLPNATADATATWAESPEIEIISNTPAMQAAFDRKSKTVEIAFWSAGEVKSSLGDISVDQPCLLMVRDEGNGIAVTASNPKNAALDLNVKVGEKSIKLSLPGGLQAGASVTQRLQ